MPVPARSYGLVYVLHYLEGTEDEDAEYWRMLITRPRLNNELVFFSFFVATLRIQWLVLNEAAGYVTDFLLSAGKNFILFVRRNVLELVKGICQIENVLRASCRIKYSNSVKFKLY